MNWDSQVISFIHITRLPDKRRKEAAATKMEVKKEAE